jgi:hypothetical protein
MICIVPFHTYFLLAFSKPSFQYCWLLLSSIHDCLNGPVADLGCDFAFAHFQAVIHYEDHFQFPSHGF